MVRVGDLGTGTTWNVGGRLSIGGDVVTEAAGGSGTLEITPGGRVDVAQDIMIFTGDILKLAGGTLAAQTINPGAGTFAWTSGTLHVGTYNGNLSNLGGTLAPGLSSGSTTIIGDYTQGGAGILEIQIGGLSPGSTYDLLSVSGTAVLGGELQLTLLGGFTPGVSDTFTVLNSPVPLVGVFSSVASGTKLATTDGRGSFVVHYGAGSAFPNQLVLTGFELAARPGDFDLDGDIDGIDFLAWQRGVGIAGTATVADGDANGDRIVDAADLAIWKANYAKASLVAATVPEPTSAVISCLVLLLWQRFGPSRSLKFAHSTERSRLPDEELHQEPQERIEGRRNRPIAGKFAYVTLDGVWLDSSWGGELKNVAMQSNGT
jgi:hypothetical protein